MNEKYKEDLINKIIDEYKECLESLEYELTDADIDDDLILTIRHKDCWDETDIPLIQRDVDDFIDGNVTCYVDCSTKFDLWDYIFLKPEGQLAKDIIDFIEVERENAFDDACRDWQDRHDCNGHLRDD